MWFVFALISLLFYAFSDLIGKKQMNDGDATTSLRLIAATNATAFFVSAGIYGLRLGESGMAPWQLIGQHPLILLSVVSHILYFAFFLLSVRFIGLSVNEAVQSTYGIFYFVGLLLVNLLLGKLVSVGQMLHPLQLIPILLVLIFTFLLPNVEVWKEHKSEKTKSERRSIRIGFLFIAAATVFDSLDSLLTTVLLEESGIGQADYLMASCFSQILPFLLLTLFLSCKDRKLFIPFIHRKKRNGNTIQAVAYAGSALFSAVFYLIACSFDAVRTGILFIAFPIIPILGAKFFLKEKYSLFQTVCIWTITLSAIFFCVADNLV